MFRQKIGLFGNVPLAFVMGVVMLCIVPCVLGAEDEYDDALEGLSLSELQNLEITVATKTKKTLRKVPAIATVITADEIRNMGARNLTDVLKMVPGFGVSTNEWGRDMFEVRGIRTQPSEKILVMIDGHRLNEPYSGSALSFIFNDHFIENAKQIEIVRGPGSALYGANAFVAVVNIITKDSEDTNGTALTVAGGSFDTKKFNLLGGYSLADDKLRISCSADYLDTDGAGLTIEEDRFSGASFSKAPGEADLSLEKKDFFLKALYGNLSLRSHFSTKERGTYIGLAHALTDSTLEHTNFWTDLAYAHSFAKDYSAGLRVYYDQFEQDAQNELFPEGFPEYPEGVLSSVIRKSRTYGTEFQFDADLSEGNHLIAGASFEHIRQYDVRHITNFDPWTFEPLGFMQDVSSWANFNKDTTRDIWAVYVQDEWELGDNLNLTAGVRYDHYDDFGGTTNPRFGLVWNFLRNADLKLLYGQAFRAPNFLELYNDGNPTVLGNPDLDPETIRTYEVSLGYRFGASHMMNVNYFYNDIDNLITRDTSTSPGQYVNRGGAEVGGIETVLRGQYSAANYWQLTYTWQDPEDADTGEELPNVPSHRASFSVNWGITKYLNAHTDILWTGSRPRVSGDTRGDTSAYTVVDLSLIARNFYKDFEIRASVHNLFDEEYEEPDTSGSQQLIPNDFPREGISALIEVSYKF